MDELFYRQFLVHHNFTKLPLNLDKIVKKMGFQDKNITNLINSFENNTLGPLKNAGFIISYETRRWFQWEEIYHT